MGTLPTIDPNQTLGQVSTAHPESTLVFLRHHLDFCCGGGRQLKDACREAGLDPTAVIHEIEAEARAKPSEHWDDRPLGELIDFIIERYHESLRADVPALVAAAQRVERVHGQKASCPVGIASLLQLLQRELFDHMTKEERVLFPAIRSGGRGGAVRMPIHTMTAEHDDHGETLRRLRELATDFVPPQGACATWRALYAGLEKLEAELMQHIHLENNVLFPRAVDAD